MLNFIITTILFSFGALANSEVQPVSDGSVPVAMITSSHYVETNDDFYVSLNTVFRGSAAGISTTFISMGESLEDAIFTYKIQNLVGDPQNISFSKLDSNNQYLLKFDTVRPGFDESTGNIEYSDVTLRVVITKNSDGTFTAK